MLVGVAVAMATPPLLFVHRTVVEPPPLPTVTKAEESPEVMPITFVPVEEEQPPAAGATVMSHVTM
jgi:hypothetical protein